MKANAPLTQPTGVCNKALAIKTAFKEYSLVGVMKSAAVIYAKYEQAKLGILK